MQWLPTYLARNLGANKESISLTAVPYIINSLVGISEYLFDLGPYYCILNTNIYYWLAPLFKLVYRKLIYEVGDAA